MERRIIDKRKKEKFMVDDEYLNGMAKLCGWKGTIVYNSLCRHANINQESFPSVEKMAEQHNVDRKTILAGVDQLESRKVIQVIKKRSKRTGRWLNNTYILLDKSEWNYSQVPVKDLDQVPVKDHKETHDLRKHTILYNTDSKKFESRSEKKVKVKKIKKRVVVLPQPKKKVKTLRRLSTALSKHQTPDEACLDYKKDCIDLGPRFIWNLVEQDSYGEKKLVQTEIDVSAEDFAELMIRLMSEFHRINAGANTLPYTASQWRNLEGMAENKKIGVSGVMKFIEMREDMDKFDSTEPLDRFSGAVYLNLGMRKLPNANTPESMSNSSSKFLNFQKWFDATVDSVYEMELDNKDDEEVEESLKELDRNLNQYRAEGRSKRDILQLLGFSR